MALHNFTNETSKTNCLIKWFDIIILFFFTSAILQFFSFINLYSFIWILIFVFIGFLYYKLRKIKLNTIYGVIAFTFFSLFNPLTYFNITGDFLIFKERYVGVEFNTSDETTTNSQDQEVYVKPFKKVGLYDIKNKRLNEIIEDLYNLNEVVITHEYIFWQTGFSEGFTPVNNKFFNENKNSLDLLENFMTIGPVVVLERVLVSIKFMLINFISFFIVHLYIRKFKTKNISYKIPVTED